MRKRHLPHAIEARGKQSGFIIGTVMIFFLIFSIIGLALLDFGGAEKQAGIRHYHRARAYYLAEGGIAQALWRLDTVSKDAASFREGDIEVVYDRDSGRITATATSANWRQRIVAVAERDHPFRHIVSYQSKLRVARDASVIPYSGSEIMMVRHFPIPDYSYYKSIADSVIESGSQGLVVLEEDFHGILFIDADVRVKESVEIRGTLAVTGTLVITGDSVLKPSDYMAPGPDGLATLPTMIAASIHIQPELQIETGGAIFASRACKIESGSHTGPIVGDDVILDDEVMVSNTGDESLFKHPPGFVYPGGMSGNIRLQPGSWRSIPL